MASSDIHLFVVILIVLGVILAFYFNRSRFYIRQSFRRFFYDNYLVEILRNKFLQLVLPSASGAYFLCLDVWGDKWDFIKNYQSQHEFIFTSLIVSSLIVLVIRGFADIYEGKSDKAYIAFMENFSLLTSKLVTHKLNRFKKEASRLRPNGDTFKQITQPKDQINLILGEIENLLFHNFSMKKSQVSITIMHKDPQSENWYYEYETNKGWNHTKAQILIDGNSTAARCLRTGEPIFHACKELASQNDEYFLSERDKRMGKGSVFCYPAFTENTSYRDDYIVSIVTYGKRLCDPIDVAQSEAVSEIFSDICRRIDLELTLDSIKTWKFDFHTNKTRGIS